MLIQLLSGATMFLNASAVDTCINDKLEDQDLRTVLDLPWRQPETINYVEGDVMCFRDIITPSSVAILRDHPEVQVIILDSTGGHVNAAEDIYNVIDDRNITVIVPKDARCLSACVILLAASNQAIVEEGSRVAVHFAYNIEFGYVHLDLDITKQMFQLIGGSLSTKMYDDYVASLIARHAITAEELATNDVWKGSVDGASWTSHAFWYLDAELLHKYGITN